MKMLFSKRIVFSSVFIVLLSLILYINTVLGVLLLLFTMALVSTFFYINNAIKKSNWYKNLFLYTDQFITNRGYRRDLRRNFRIVNVGSNPALFAFEYDDTIGQNWATGTQGPEMDFEIIKYYHSYIKEGGVVLLPIVPFSSCTPYLWHKKQFLLGRKYYIRFAKVLESRTQARKIIPDYERIMKWIEYPLFFTPSLLRLIIKDVPIDNRKNLEVQSMGEFELSKDAKKWMDGWKKEFDIKDLDKELNLFLKDCQLECADKYLEIIRFCKERNLKPVLIIPPVTRVLNDCFSETMKDKYIYSFVNYIQSKESVAFLDYMSSEEFVDSSLYFNSLFLNRQGRLLFTNRVLSDLKIQ